MTQADDDEWAKVREMVRNAPPGTAQTQWSPNELTHEVPRRTFPKKAFVVVLLLGVVAVGGYYAFENRESLLGANDSAAGAGTPGADRTATGTVVVTAPTPAPVAAQANRAGDAVTLSVRKDAKNVSVRATPTTAGAVVGRLSGGERVEKLAESDGWVRVRFQVSGKSTEGWIRRDFLVE